MNPIFSCPIVLAPVGLLSISRLGFGEDKRVNVVYSPRKVLGDRDYPCLDPQHEDCLETDFQVSTCLERRGQASPALQLNGNSILDGILPSSIRMGLSSDTLGMMISKKGTCDHISGYQIDKSISLSVSSQEAGMVHEVSKGINAELGPYPFSVASHETIKSIDTVNEQVHASHYSGTSVISKSKKRLPKPIKKITLVLMTLGEDVLLNDIVLTNALTLVGRFGRRNYNS